MADLEWPTDLGFATLVGRLLHMEGDSSDEDRKPNVRPVTGGSVLVEPAVKSVRYIGEQGVALFVKGPTKGLINDEGYICTPGPDGKAGAPGIIIPATDNALLNPTDFTYKVTLKGGSWSSTYSIEARTGETIDLALATPVSSSGGSVVVIDTTIAARAEEAASRAEAIAADIPSAIEEALNNGNYIGPEGASVTGVIDNGDQTVTFTFSDDSVSSPIPIYGATGVGIASVSDPNVNSMVTITYTDGSTTVVKAIVGKPGADSTVPGPVNVISIGEVTTVGPETPASATITGEAPEQTLDLVLPRGLPGIDGEDGVTPDLTGYVTGTTVTEIWSGTQAAYDSLTPSPSTLYLITEA